MNYDADWKQMEVCPTNNTANDNTTDNAYEINSNETDTERDIVEVDDDDDEEDDTDSDNPFLPSEDGREKREKEIQRVSLQI